MKLVLTQRMRFELAERLRALRSDEEAVDGIAEVMGFDERTPAGVELVLDAAVAWLEKGGVSA
jgi:hypothetical protein